MAEDHRRLVMKELGALTGHKNPEAFADFMLAPDCAHHGNHWFDNEPCPPPCGRTHTRCCSCWCPLPRSECLIPEDLPLPGAEGSERSDP